MLDRCLLKSRVQFALKFLIMSVHCKCRNAFYAGSDVARLQVPDEKVSWSISWPDYKPPLFTSPQAIDKPWSDDDTRLSRKVDYIENPDQLPEITFSHMYVYLICTPSPNTKEAVKAFKSLNASTAFLQAGWIRSLGMHIFNAENEERFLFLGKVMHSQKANADPLEPWFVAKQKGEIVGAHCTCMAGLGEVCSHVASLMLAVIKASEHRIDCGQHAPTSNLCKWLPAKGEVTAATIQEIDFRTPSMKMGGGQKVTSPQLLKVLSAVKQPDAAELEQFYATMNKTAEKKKPVILRILKEFAHEHQPKIASPKMPKPISALYNPNNLTAPFDKLLAEGKNTLATLKITNEEVEEVELNTRNQATSNVWFLYKEGMITASNFHAAAHSREGMPAESLVKKICYPKLNSFETKETRWGCVHEDRARNAYLDVNRLKHTDLTVRKCGLYISQTHPFIAASPDGLIECGCCGSGVLEIKCPFKHRHGLPEKNTDATFCMALVNGKWHLKKQHAYYLQVQTQMFACGMKYADFVVWTEKSVVSDRIEYDVSMFEGQLGNVTSFYLNGILPEILGKWFTRKSAAVLTDNLQQPGTSSAKQQFCYCQATDSGTMIACEGDNCRYEWFHMTCLNLKRVPKGNWYCAECRKGRKSQCSGKENVINKKIKLFHWNQLDDTVDRRSHNGAYVISNGMPQNPKGRTGLGLRGILGRWGPNHAADPIVTRWKRAENGTVVTNHTSKLRILQFVAIKRSDTKEWAIPGGMVDPGEVVSKTLQREFAEESLNMLDMDATEKMKIQTMLTPFFSHGTEVYRGYVDDPRNTDNSWMETVAYNFHDEDGSAVGSFNLNAGDDAVGVRWVDIDSKLKLYASHIDLLKQVVTLRDANW